MYYRKGVGHSNERERERERATNRHRERDKDREISFLPSIYCCSQPDKIIDFRSMKLGSTGSCYIKEGKAVGSKGCRM